MKMSERYLPACLVRMKAIKAQSKKSSLSRVNLLLDCDTLSTLFFPVDYIKENTSIVCCGSQVQAVASFSTYKISSESLGDHHGPSVRRMNALLRVQHTDVLRIRSTASDNVASTIYLARPETPHCHAS